MKITALTFIFALFAVVSFAQIKKGTWTIDANSRIVDYYGASSSYPHFGRRAAGFIDANYFLTPKMTVGTRSEVIRYLNLGGLRKVQYNISPYFRYYFTPNKPLKFYGETSLSFDVYEDPYPIMRIFQPKFELGFNYFVTPNGALEFGVGTSFLEYAIGTTETYFGTHFNLVPRVGVRLFFNTETDNKKYLPKDYLKSGNYSLGLSGYISAQGDQYGIQSELRLLRDYDLQSGYDFKLNFNYFLIHRLSVGTTIELASYELPFCRMSPTIIINQYPRECEVKWRTAMVAEYTQPINSKGSLQISVGGGVVLRDKSGKKYATPGINYRLTAKIQGFVAENMSLWGGIAYEPDMPSTSRQLLREVTFVGIQYYIMSKRNKK